MRAQQAADAAGHGQQNRIAARNAHAFIQTAEAIQIHHHHGGTDIFTPARQRQQMRHPINEQSLIGQARQMVSDGIFQNALFGELVAGGLGQRADNPDHGAVFGHQGA